MVTNRKHCIYSHFPKDRNCDVCLRSKITRFRCRRGDEGSIPRAVKFGDLITADHKISNEGSESRNNHRYAVVVQDLATQWIQSHPYKIKTSQETEYSLRKFMEPSQQPKVVYTDNSLEFGKSCEELSWSHRTSRPHRSETNGSAERAVRRVEEGTSAVLLQSGLDEKWWSDSMECYCYLRNVQDLLTDGNSENPTIRKESITRNFFIGYALIAGRIWKGDILIADNEELEQLDASEIYPRRLNAKGFLRSQKKGEFVSPVADGSAKLSGRDYAFQEPTRRRESTVRRENRSGESHGDREEFRPEETKDDAAIHQDFWSIQGDFIYHHHVEPGVQLYVPNEESFPIPLKYIDVLRSTHKDLDVA